ncbi:TPA: hypothetical protein ACUTUG_001430 [Legionella pneumophila]|uniref:hypothetical protein n=1 Tax=Legionella pneumophila TaxID=446 RepID=UPI001C14DDE9|nr:hypothetical protein [Legionella pneumophila]
MRFSIERSILDNNLISLLQSANNSQINMAGPRYTPGQEKDAPNLEIKELNTLFEYLAISEQALDEIKSIANELLVQYREHKKEFSKLINSFENKPTRMATILNQLGAASDNKRKILINELKTISQNCKLHIQNELNQLYEQTRALKDHSDNKRNIEHKIYRLRKFEDSIEAVFSLADSLKINLLHQKKLLLLGEWGTGKTHLLCDFSKKKLDAGWPVILMLAHKMTDSNDPFFDYLHNKNLGNSIESFLKKLNDYARNKRARAFIIFDGVNEGCRKKWSTFLRKLLSQIDCYKHIALIISCRTPFEQMMFTKKFRNNFVVAYHHGFSEIEFDAQLEFFSYYNIPAPTVPLLSDEFSRPLFLKVVCESLQELSERVKKKRWKEIINGQKSFNHILESFIKKVSAPLTKKYKLPNDHYWKIIKDNKTNSIAGFMAENARNYIFPSELISILEERKQFTNSKAKKFIQEMLTTGILSEDIIWKDHNPQPIYKLPYEKFSDHIIARHLLEKIDYSSYSKIKRSFYSNMQLGSSFVVDRHGYQYAFPSIAEALMLEFPERLININFECHKELYFWLPEKNRSITPLIDTFVNGLCWRTSDSFSKDTSNIVNFIFAHVNGYRTHRLLDALTSIATRSHHPWNAERLYNYLLKMTMKERDLFWNEYIRNASPNSIVYKIPIWLDKNSQLDIKGEENKNLIVLMSLFLGTTDRNIRDRYTKALVNVGCKDPDNLFSHSLRIFEFNDPYVIERMLAASYGCILKLQAKFIQPGRFRDLSIKFAQNLYQLFFENNSSHYTTHHLIRGYVWGILDILNNGQPKLPQMIKSDIFLPPYTRTSKIPHANKIRYSDVESVQTALGMDFKNYTLGHLVKNRCNYDFANNDYKKILKRVLWRIKDLGYSSNDFKNIDMSISREDWNRGNEPDKVERYGKKYSWIAYFELYGEMQDKGIIEKDNSFHRCSDCGVDPSFPTQPDTWNPSFNDIFHITPTSINCWLNEGPSPEYTNIIETGEIQGIPGEWVMLDGYLTEIDSNHFREIFSFIRGLIVKNENIQVLKQILEEVDYPGNGFIPEPSEEYYTFAGEVPLAKNFSQHLRTKRNGARKDLRTIELRKEKITHQPVPKAWYKLTDVSEGENEIGVIDLLYRDGNGDTVNEYLKKVEKINRQLPKNERIQLKDLISPPSEEEMKQGYFTRTEFELIAKTEVEIPIHRFSWESHHSTQNQVSGFSIPSLKILSDLQLMNSGDGFKFIDKKGELAAFALKINMGAQKFNSPHGTYIRKDLLIKYLKKSNSSLVWFIWGERTVTADVFKDNSEIVYATRENWSNLHKKVCIFTV